MISIYYRIKKTTSESTLKTPKPEWKHNFASESSGASLIEYPRDSNGASGILSGSKEKYLIIQSTSQKSFVISLSEDAIIDTFMLMNLEEFSWTVKEFDLYGSDSYVSHDQKWDKLGTFTAQQLNNEWQTFKFKESWIRYLKFEWKNYYGSHYYCTLTQIKACGRTMVQGLKENLKSIEKEPEPKPIALSKHKPDSFNNSTLLNITDSHQNYNLTKIIQDEKNSITTIKKWAKVPDYLFFSHIWIKNIKIIKPRDEFEEIKSLSFDKNIFIKMFTTFDQSLKQLSTKAFHLQEHISKLESRLVYKEKVYKALSDEINLLKIKIDVQNQSIDHIKYLWFFICLLLIFILFGWYSLCIKWAKSIY